MTKKRKTRSDKGKKKSLEIPTHKNTEKVKVTVDEPVTLVEPEEIVAVTIPFRGKCDNPLCRYIGRFDMNSIGTPKARCPMCRKVQDAR